MTELARIRLRRQLRTTAALLALLASPSIYAAPPQSNILKTLPHVATVEDKPIDKPNCYIIHILDWHLVDKAAFIADMEEQGITDDLDVKYAKHLDDVEAVQAQQREVLKQLIERYKVAEVFVEGLSRETEVEYTEQLEHLAKQDMIWDLLQRTAEVDPDLKNVVMVLRTARLSVGAAGQLHMDGALKTRPAEDNVAHEAARPVRKDGEVRFDPMLNDAREDAIVKNVLAGGPVSVLVLSGAHDLSDNVPDDCQYIRIGTKAYEAMTGG